MTNRVLYLPERVQMCRMARRAGKLAEWHCVTPPYQCQIEMRLKNGKLVQA